jgi:hypothetical protein
VGGATPRATGTSGTLATPAAPPGVVATPCHSTPLTRESSLTGAAKDEIGLEGGDCDSWHIPHGGKSPALAHSHAQMAFPIGSSRLIMPAKLVVTQARSS